ncbi:MAG: hypothetical protein ACR2ON_00620 [Paracoccaceae bacterium]
MIRIVRNPNFTQWWNILVNGKLVDNARSHAHALHIANRLKTKNDIVVG